MTPPRTQPEGSPSGIAAWRQARLELAGLEGPAASVLARQAGVDLHALLDLIDRGCPPHLAARICAPIDGEQVHG